MKHLVVHIVDDDSWGGVNRLLACLEGAQDGARDEHRIMRVERGQRNAPKIEADVIVSHMSACWKNLPYFSSLRGSNPNTPLLHVEHSYSEHFVALKVQNRTRFDDLLNLTYCLFDKVIAVSEPQKSWLARKGYCQPEQLILISSCVALAPFFKVPRRKTGRLLRLGCIGRFHEQKGFDIIVAAFQAAQPTDIELVMIGDGPMMPDLVALADGNPNIVFAGRTDNPAAALADCDVIAIPSRWEPYGLVALESMAAKRAVLCPAVDGLQQHIDAGAHAMGDNTVAGWQRLLSSGEIHRLAKHPAPLRRLAHAEQAFIKSWDDLIFTLLEGTEKDQMAA